MRKYIKQILLLRVLFNERLNGILLIQKKQDIETYVVRKKGLDKLDLLLTFGYLISFSTLLPLHRMRWPGNINWPTRNLAAVFCFYGVRYVSFIIFYEKNYLMVRY